MLALTHVCIWSGKEWKRISAQEAAQIFPHGTSSHSGLFMCELCGQYVNFINGSVQNCHFRHSSKEQNKECIDRSEEYGYLRYFNKAKNQLPLRIRIISKYKFEFEIGFINLPIELYKDKRKIIINSDDKSEGIYNYAFSRLDYRYITYLSVSSIPVNEYHISILPSNNQISLFWPNIVNGVSENGTLFDKVTRKRIEYDSDITIGHIYYLVTTKRIINYNENIQINCISSMHYKWKNWYAYEVEATKLAENSAKFFLDLHYRLTDKPFNMSVIWPVCVKAPYIIYHHSDELYIHIHGNNIESKLAPIGKISRYNDSNVISIISSSCQQLLSIGRTRVLKFMYLWQKKLNFINDKNYVEVKDLQGNNLNDGIQNIIPYKKSIVVYSFVDGFIEILQEKKYSMQI